VVAVPPRDAGEEVVERPDRAAEEAAAALEQVALYDLTVEAIGDDEDGLPVDRLEVAVEETRHLPRVRRADQQGQRHSPQSSPSLGGLRIGSKAAENHAFGLDSRLRPAASACRGTPWHLAGAVVAEIRGLGAATRVCVRDTHGRTFTFVDFLSTIVTNENRLPCQKILQFFARRVRLI
jgi:hypothetical protein